MPHAAPTPTSTSRLPSLPLQSGLFITAFVCAHLAALGAAYAAAAIQAKGHELTANAPGHNAVHHLGRMTLVPVSTLPSATRR